MTPEKLVQGVKQTVSLPEVCVRVNQMVESPKYAAQDIGDVISQDTDLSARLLRTVNSAFYGMPGPIETISRAVTIIGTRDLRDLAFMTAARQVFTGIPVDLMNMTEFWHYAVTTGVIGRILARKCNILHGERLFVMGVLHDIGRLVIFQSLPEQARDILLITEGNDDLLVAAEDDVLGFNHAEVGFELLKHWKLPESIQTVVRHHHDPQRAEEYSLETALISLASMMAHGEAWGVDLEETQARVHPSVWKITGLDRDALTEIMEQVFEQVAEMSQLVLGPGGQRQRPVT